ncbi:MAG: hypothetical protein WED05_04890 [Candidatus Atabeyarchaeum deiterrae]
MDYSRLGVAVGITTIPLYLWVLLFIVPPDVKFQIANPVLFALTQYFAAPLFFSIPWILFIYLGRDRLSASIKHMTETSYIIPVRWRIFYGFNTLIVLLVFGLPFLSPVLAVIGGIILVGRIYYGAESIRKKSRRARAFLIFLLLIIFGGTPTIILIYFLSRYIGLYYVITSFWSSIIQNIYAFTLCIGDALAVGSLLWFIYAGAAEFEFQAYGLRISKPPAKLIWLFEAIVFAIFVVIGLQYFLTPSLPLPGSSSTLNLINIVCLGIVGVIFLVSTFKGLKRTRGRSSVWGLIFLMAFLALYVFTLANPTPDAASIAVFSAAGLFLLMYFISYLKVRPK